LPDEAGSVSTGRDVFFRKETPKCCVCHAIGDEQGKAAPNLQGLGARYSKDELLDALLDPSREIADGFAVQIIETRSLGLVVGVVASETPRLLVRTELGDEIEVPPDEVLARRESDRSMMPDDLTDALSDQELLDLLAFLESLKE